MGTNVPDIDFNLVELAKQQAAIASLLAGFALTIVVLLISRAEVAEDSPQGLSSHRAVSCFVGAFFLGVLAAFMFSEVGCELVSQTGALLHRERSLAGYYFAAVPFIFSANLLTLGLSHALCAYRLHRQHRALGALVVAATGIVSATFLSTCPSKLLAWQGVQDTLVEVFVPVGLLGVVVVTALKFRLKDDERTDRHAWFVGFLTAVSLACGFALDQALDKHTLPAAWMICLTLFTVEVSLVATSFLMPSLSDLRPAKRSGTKPAAKGKSPRKA